MLLASHNMKEERLTNKIIMMKQGKIVDEGTCNDLINKHGEKILRILF